MDVDNALVCETRRTGIFLFLHYIRQEYLQTHGCFWYISYVSDVSNLTTFLVTVDEMADPELTAALAELMACSRRQLVAKFKQSNTPVWVAVQNRGEDVRSCL